MNELIKITLQCGHGRLLDTARLCLYNLINDAIIDSLLRCHEEIAVAILLNLVLGLIAVLGNVRVEDLPNEQNLLGLDLNVGRLSLRAAEGLVDHNPRVGQGPALALGAGAEEEGPHRRGHPEADGRNVAGDVLHGVVNGHAGRDGAAGAVDVEGDVGLGILVGQVQQLGDEDVRHLVVDALAEEEDAILEEAGDDVHLAALGVNDGHSDGRGRGLLVGVAPTGIDLGLRLLGHHGGDPAVGAVGTGQGGHSQGRRGRGRRVRRSECARLRRSERREGQCNKLHSSFSWLLPVAGSSPPRDAAATCERATKRRDEATKQVGASAAGSWVFLTPYRKRS